MLILVILSRFFFCFITKFNFSSISDSIVQLGRSSTGSVDEPKARTDCSESSQSPECSVAVKSHPKSNAATRAHHHKLRVAQQNLKSTPIRRKVTQQNANKKTPVKAAISTPKPASQVVNRARGTLHGLSTIKRHGNVRVTYVFTALF